MLNKKINLSFLVIPMTLAMSSVSFAADQTFTTHDSSWSKGVNSGKTMQSLPNQTAGISTNVSAIYDADTDNKMRALIGMGAISQSKPAQLSALAQNMNISNTQMNTLYVASLATLDTYAQTSRDEISNWCKKFSRQTSDAAVSAIDLTDYQQSLVAIDAVVLGAVFDKLSASYPQAYATMMNNTQSFTVQSTKVDHNSIAPDVWLKNHRAACAQF